MNTKILCICLVDIDWEVASSCPRKLRFSYRFFAQRQSWPRIHNGRYDCGHLSSGSISSRSHSLKLTLCPATKQCWIHFRDHRALRIVLLILTLSYGCSIYAILRRILKMAHLERVITNIGRDPFILSMTYICICSYFLANFLLPNIINPQSGTFCIVFIWCVNNEMCLCVEM